MIANVTQEHIDKGIRRSCTECPVAMCLQEYNPHLRVDGTFISIRDKFGVPDYALPIVCLLPLEAFQFINNFDCHPDNPWRTKPEPFSFHISAEAFMR